MKFNQLSLVSLILSGFSVQAAAAPNIDPTSTKDFEILGVKINSDSYGAVVDKLGDTKLVRAKSTGAGPSGPSTFCYQSKDGMRVTFIEGFSSDYSQVTGYRLEAHSSRKSLKGCAGLAKLNGAIRTPNGLGLGLNKKEVEGILGQPKKDLANTWEYNFEKHLMYGTSGDKDSSAGGSNSRGMVVDLDVTVAFDRQNKVRKLELEFGGEPD